MRFSQSSHFGLSVFVTALLFLGVGGLLSGSIKPSLGDTDTAKWFKAKQESVLKRKLILSQDPYQDIRLLQVKNLDSENWLQNLEIKIKNEASKPIYYAAIWVNLPEIRYAEGPLAYWGFLLEFGNSKLVSFSERASSDDKFIAPGSEYTFTIPKKQIENYFKFLERIKAQLGDVPEIKKIVLNLYLFNFGDGTGYQAGQPVPIRKNDQSSYTFPPQYETDLSNSRFRN
ncbi:MAG: hypothetical protein JNJ50_01430 [Acidobacteria bacterium]|nr:hypothetical protein [Acidobacteriota bacterium]